MPLETFLDTVNEVLQFGFNDGPQVNRPRVKNWVNEAQFQIAREVEAPEFQETQQIILAQGTYQYALPANFLRAQDVWYPYLATRLRPMDIQQFDMTSPQQVQGPPAMYTLYQSNLWVFPTPNNSQDELLLRYIKKPPLLVADTDVPLLNPNYLHLLVDYGVVRAFEAEDDYEAAQYFTGRYKSDLAAYATDVQDRTVDRPRTIDGTWMGGSFGSRGVI